MVSLSTKVRSSSGLTHQQSKAATSRGERSGSTSSLAAAVRGAGGTSSTASSFESISSTGQRVLTTSERTASGGTLTLSPTGLLVETSASGRLISRSQVDPTQAQELISSRASASEIKQASSRTPSVAEQISPIPQSPAQQNDFFGPGFPTQQPTKMSEARTPSPTDAGFFGPGFGSNRRDVSSLTNQTDTSIVTPLQTSSNQDFFGAGFGSNKKDPALLSAEMNKINDKNLSYFGRVKRDALKLNAEYKTEQSQKSRLRKIYEATPLYLALNAGKVAGDVTKSMDVVTPTSLKDNLDRIKTSAFETYTLAPGEDRKYALDPIKAKQYGTSEYNLKSFLPVADERNPDATILKTKTQQLEAAIGTGIGTAGIVYSWAFPFGKGKVAGQTAKHAPAATRGFGAIYGLIDNVDDAIGITKRARNIPGVGRVVGGVVDYVAKPALVVETYHWAFGQAKEVITPKSFKSNIPDDLKKQIYRQNVNLKSDFESSRSAYKDSGRLWDRDIPTIPVRIPFIGDFSEDRSVKSTVYGSALSFIPFYSSKKSSALFKELNIKSAKDAGYSDTEALQFSREASASERLESVETFSIVAGFESKANILGFESVLKGKNTLKMIIPKTKAKLAGGAKALTSKEARKQSITNALAWAKTKVGPGWVEGFGTGYGYETVRGSPLLKLYDDVKPQAARNAIDNPKYFPNVQTRTLNITREQLTKNPDLYKPGLNENLILNIKEPQTYGSMKTITTAEGETTTQDVFDSTTQLKYVVSTPAIEGGKKFRPHGKLVTGAIGGVVGIGTAYLYGFGEGYLRGKTNIKTKIVDGKVKTPIIPRTVERGYELVGYASDLPEYPSDIMTPGIFPKENARNILKARGEIESRVVVSNVPFGSSTGAGKDIQKRVLLQSQTSKTSMTTSINNVVFSTDRGSITQDKTFMAQRRGGGSSTQFQATKSDVLSNSIINTNTGVNQNTQAINTGVNQQTSQTTDVNVLQNTLSTQDVLQDTLQKQDTVQNILSNVNVNTMTPNFGFPPLLPGGGGGSGNFRFPTGKRRATKFTPSLVATGLRIFGKKPKGLTGLEVRPISPSARRRVGIFDAGFKRAQKPIKLTSVQKRRVRGKKKKKKKTVLSAVLGG